MENRMTIEEKVQQLNGLFTEENKQTVVNYLSDLFTQIGYKAIGEEIKYGRHAKDNALYGLKLFRRDKTGDRINPSTNEVYKVPGEHVNDVGRFCNMLESIIDTYLDNGTDKQKEYLKIKGEYENASYLFHESMFKLNQFFDTMERGDENKEEYNRIKGEYERLNVLAKEAKNKLDQFVLNNLN